MPGKSKESRLAKASLEFVDVVHRFFHICQVSRKYPRAVHLDGTDPRPQNNLGLAYESKTDYAKAIDAYKAARRIWHDNAQYRSAMDNRIRTLQLHLDEGR